MDALLPVEGGQVWLSNNGFYNMCSLYTKGDMLLAKKGSSYVQLRGKQGTSVSKMFWREIDPGEHHILVDNNLHPPTLEPKPMKVGKKRKKAASLDEPAPS